ncbi:MAG: hypothetical protein HYT31_02510 [Parcubacteria group bacterium]|nr:hypothetical protein [Parcubacteria group bacterium]
MQKYFNAIYAAVLIGLVVFVVKIQLFGQVADVQSSLDSQAETMNQLQGDIEAIVGAINKQIQAGQQQPES